VKNDRQPSHSTALLTFSIVTLLATGPAFAQGTTSSDLPRGWVPPTSIGLFAEPQLLRKLANSSDGSLTGERDPQDGPYAEMGHMISGSGWLSAGPGYRRHVLGGAALVDLSAAVSTNLYKMAQGRIEWPHVAHDHLALGAQLIYRDMVQVNYFGVGPDSLEANRSAYRFNDIDVLGHATVRATTWLSVNGRFGWIARPDISSPTGRNVTVPNTVDLFSEATAPGIRTPVPLLHGDVSVSADWRDYPGHPNRGGFYRAGAAAYSDRDAGTYSFRRYEVEGSQFVPLIARRWVLALHGWEVFSDTSGGSVVPFYLMPSLGGQNTMRGFHDFRFHDNNMQVFNAESRWALFAHVDAAVFADAGKVAPRAGDLDFNHLRRSFGAGLRVHNATTTLARLDIGHSAEGWLVFFKISDPLKRTQPAFGRSSVVPFVP
jgi:outer membrane protein assembly factor BamA